MSEKTDKVTWQEADTTGVPILGRTQAKLMNYISYPEIHAPLGQGQSPVSTDSFKSTDYVHSLETTNNSLQSTKTAVYGQSQDYTHNQSGCPRRTQSCNQSEVKHST